MDYQELIERMRGFETDHEPNGWPAIQMRDISAMCDAIESLLNALDVADSEVKRTAAERDAALAKLAKYRDAPVVAYVQADPDGHLMLAEITKTAEAQQLDQWDKQMGWMLVPLIVKPG